MPTDLIRYDILAQEALRGLVRNVLADAAKRGLPGDHHFYISFDTTAEGVRLSARLREQYPEEMTIVLQHQFWDLKVSGEGFEVGLSFGGVPERLVVPFDAITGFRDPSVQFALQFETLDSAAETAPEQSPASTSEHKPRAKPRSRTRAPARQDAVRTSVPAAPAAQPDKSAAADTATPAGKSGDGPGDKPGAEVVRLDRFRKK
jgi:uncharacterized protein